MRRTSSKDMASELEMDSKSMRPSVSYMQGKRKSLFGQRNSLAEGGDDPLLYMVPNNDLLNNMSVIQKHKRQRTRFSLLKEKLFNQDSPIYTKREFQKQLRVNKQQKFIENLKRESINMEITNLRAPKKLLKRKIIIHAFWHLNFFHRLFLGISHFLLSLDSSLIFYLEFIVLASSLLLLASVKREFFPRKKIQNRTIDYYIQKKFQFFRFIARIVVEKFPRQLLFQKNPILVTILHILCIIPAIVNITHPEFGESMEMMAFRCFRIAYLIPLLEYFKIPKSYFWAIVPVYTMAMLIQALNSIGITLLLKNNENFLFCLLSVVSKILGISTNYFIALDHNAFIVFTIILVESLGFFAIYKRENSIIHSVLKREIREKEIIPTIILLGDLNPKEFKEFLFNFYGFTKESELSSKTALNFKIISSDKLLKKELQYFENYNHVKISSSISPEDFERSVSIFYYDISKRVWRDIELYKILYQNKEKVYYISSADSINTKMLNFKFNFDFDKIFSSILAFNVQNKGFQCILNHIFFRSCLSEETFDSDKISNYATSFKYDIISCRFSKFFYGWKFNEVCKVLHFTLLNEEKNGYKPIITLGVENRPLHDSTRSFQRMTKTFSSAGSNEEETKRKEPKFMINPKLHVIGKDDIGLFIVSHPFLQKLIEEFNNNDFYVYLSIVEKYKNTKEFNDTANMYICETVSVCKSKESDFKIEKLYNFSYNRKLFPLNYPEEYVDLSLIDKASFKFKGHVIIFNCIKAVSHFACTLEKYSERPIVFFSEKDIDLNWWQSIINHQNIFYFYGKFQNQIHLDKLDIENSYRVLLVNESGDEEILTLERNLRFKYPNASILIELKDLSSLVYLPCKPQLANTQKEFWPYMCSGNIITKSIIYSMISSSVYCPTVINFLKCLFEKNLASNHSVFSLVINEKCGYYFNSYGQFIWHLISVEENIIPLALIKNSDSSLGTKFSSMRSMTAKRSTIKKAFDISMYEKIDLKKWRKEIVITNPNLETVVTGGDEVIIFGNLDSFSKKIDEINTNMKKSRIMMAENNSRVHSDFSMIDQRKNSRTMEIREVDSSEDEGSNLDSLNSKSSACSHDPFVNFQTLLKNKLVYTPLANLKNRILIKDQIINCLSNGVDSLKILSTYSNHYQRLKKINS